MTSLYPRKRGTRTLWTPATWDEGRMNSQGRFKVYRPDCPRVSHGWALRAHVVWWLETGETHPEGTHLHHINGDRTDDRFLNLEVLTPEEHRKRHPAKLASVVCKQCGKEFVRKASREKYHKQQYCSLKCFGATVSGPQLERGEFQCQYCTKTFQADRPTYKFSFCSLACYHAKRAEKVPQYICGYCGKQFTDDPGKKRRYCSISCAAKDRVAKQKSKSADPVGGHKQ